MRKIGVLLALASVMGVAAASLNTNGSNLTPQDTTGSEGRRPQTRTETTTNGDEVMFWLDQER